jgi:hypothetical protein
LVEDLVQNMLVCNFLLSHTEKDQSRSRRRKGRALSSFFSPYFEIHNQLMMPFGGLCSVG